MRLERTSKCSAGIDILTRWQTSHVWICRRDSPALGYINRYRAARLAIGRPFEFGVCSGILARWQLGGVRIYRQDNPALGYSNRYRAARLERPFRCGVCSGILARWQAVSIRI